MTAEPALQLELPEILISPEISLFDSDLDIFEVRNLQPNTRYNITVRLFHKHSFMSTAVLISDENGNIEVGKSIAHEGNYNGKDIMGLFTSLYHETRAKFGTTISLMPLPKELEYTITVQKRNAYSIGKVIAEKKIWRTLLSDDVDRIEIDDPILEGTLFKPKGPGPFPCVLDMYGFLGIQEHRAALLAEKNFAVLALKLYGGKKTPKVMQMMEESYLVKAVDWLLSQPFSSKTVGIFATSAGAVYGCKLASIHPEVSCMIGINGSSTPRLHTCHCINGKLVPFQKAEFEDFANYDFYRGAMNYSKGHTSDVYSEEVKLKIEESRAKFMFIAGGDDGTTNSIQELGYMVERMKQEHDVCSYVFEKAGHTIDPPYVPVQDVAYVKNLELMLNFGGHPYHHGVAQRELWPKCINFLKENILIETENKAKL